MLKASKYFLVVLLLLPISVKAQNQASSSHSTGGKVIYSAHVSMYSWPSTIDTLLFTPKKSIFRWQWHSKAQIKEKSKKEAKRLKNKMRQKGSLGFVKVIQDKSTPRVRRVNLFNVVKDSLYSRRLLLDHIYLIKEPKPVIHWNITDSTKKIGKFVCTKATAHFRGRDYVAWFTPQIPVPYGPWKLLGLPGLILQAYDSQKNIVFTAQKVTLNKDNISIETILRNGKGKVIGMTEYKKIMTHLNKRAKKMAMEKAQKVMRKLRRKYPNAKIESAKTKIKVKSRQMEIFGNDEK